MVISSFLTPKRIVGLQMRTGSVMPLAGSGQHQQSGLPQPDVSGHCSYCIEIGVVNVYSAESP